jgi:hypothetical protein
MDSFVEIDREQPEGEAPASVTVHRIDIEPITPIGPSSLKGENRVQKYKVSYRGENLIESTREPVYSSCRALVARGLTGKLEVWGGEPYARGIVKDIEKGAKLTIVENENEGPRLGRYKPWTSETMRNIKVA